MTGEEITRLLAEAAAGDFSVWHELAPLIYEDFKAIAHERLRSVPVGSTMTTGDLANEAFSLHRMLIRSITGNYPSDDHYNGQSALGFLIAQSSGLTFELKQAMLESRSENVRLQLLIEHLREILPMVESVDATRTSIHNNWAMHQALKSKSEFK